MRTARQLTNADMDTYMRTDTDTDKSELLFCTSNAYTLKLHKNTHPVTVVLESTHCYLTRHSGITVYQTRAVLQLNETANSYLTQSRWRYCVSSMHTVRRAQYHTIVTERTRGVVSRLHTYIGTRTYIQR